MTFQVIDDFLPADDYRKLLTFVQDQPMRYGSKSNGKTDPYGHWSWKPIHDNQKNLADLAFTLPPILRDAWDKTIKLIGPIGNTALIRSYANGYTYGTDGYFHTDSDRHDERTIILYMCDKWEDDWGGETVCGKPMQAVLPAPNRALIINSDQPHAARAVSRKCNVIRTTLMFKTRPKRSQWFEHLSQWLVGRGALKFEHSKGTLHDHLVRVFDLLMRRDGMTLEVAYAGGLHSIYGTNVYQKQLLVPTPNTRGVVASQFGKEAEALAYLFSVLNRPGCFERVLPHKEDNWGLEMRHDQTMTVSAIQLRSLQLIEAANLLDQDSLSKWPNIKAVWEAAG